MLSHPVIYMSYNLRTGVGGEFNLRTGISAFQNLEASNLTTGTVYYHMARGVAADGVDDAVQGRGT